jgi:serine/threonine protein kinase
VLPAALADDPVRRERFEREARSISRLEHPNICPLYDVGELPAGAGGGLFLVMQFLEGESLAQRTARGPLSIKETLDVGIQIAEALAAAHRAGIVHRDLKPGNVMLTRAGARLLDFGLARTVTTASRRSSPTPWTMSPPGGGVCRGGPGARVSAAAAPAARVAVVGRSPRHDAIHCHRIAQRLPGARPLRPGADRRGRSPRRPGSVVGLDHPTCRTAQ